MPDIQITNNQLSYLWEKLKDFYHYDPGTEFMSTWKNLCLKYPHANIIEAINIIKAEKEWLPKIPTWIAVLSAIKDRHSRANQPKAKPLSYTKHDEDTIAWKQNLDSFTSGKITRRQYLNNALKINQMTLLEYNNEIEHYKRTNRDLDHYCNVVNDNLF